MTNEQILQKLKVFRDNGKVLLDPCLIDKDRLWKEMTEVFDMAIEALSCSDNPNNSDCISRQAAIEVIDAVFPVDPMKSEYAQGIACGAALAKTYVEQLPSAQPQHKTGRWIYNSPVTMRCDQCGYVVKDLEWSKANYCAGCGSPMRKEGEG